MRRNTLFFTLKTQPFSGSRFDGNIVDSGVQVEGELGSHVIDVRIKLRKLSRDDAVDVADFVALFFYCLHDFVEEDDA